MSHDAVRCQLDVSPIIKLPLVDGLPCGGHQRRVMVEVVFAEQAMGEYLAGDVEVPDVRATEALATDGAATGFVEGTRIRAVASILES